MKHRISGFKPFTIYIILLAIGAGLLLFAGYKHYAKPKLGTVFSASGEVVSVSDNKVVFGSAVLVKAAGGNVIGHENKTAIIEPTTKIQKSGSAKAYSISDIKPGGQITAYFSSDPQDVDDLAADRIIIQ